MTASEAHDTLQDLLAERAAVVAGSVTVDGPTLADLDEMIEDARTAWIGAAITEIATLRAMLSGAQYG
jgi:hypothetical protein